MLLLALVIEAFIAIAIVTFVAVEAKKILTEEH